MVSILKLLVPLVLAVMVVSAPPAAESAALTCATATEDLTPCITYLMGGALSEDCCDGVRSLNEAAQTTPDRQAACRCLKDNVNSFPGVDLDAAAGLPKKCGVYIPYKISPSTNCDSVK